MAKATAFFAFVLFARLIRAGAYPFIPRQVLTTQIRDEQTKRMLSISGGDLRKIKDTTLANVFSVMCAKDAVGSLCTITSMKFIGVDVQEGSLSNFFLHHIGGSSAATAISLYLATNGIKPVEEAIGYGFLAHLASMLFMLATGKHKETGHGDARFLTMTGVLATSIYSLLSGNWEPLAWAKVVSLLLGFHGFLLFTKPEDALKISIKNDEDGESS